MFDLKTRHYSIEPATDKLNSRSYPAEMPYQDYCPIIPSLLVRGIFAAIEAKDYGRPTPNLTLRRDILFCS